MQFFSMSDLPLEPWYGGGGMGMGDEGSGGGVGFRGRGHFRGLSIYDFM